MLPIFIALKSPSHSARFEPANLGSNGKHAKHHTTEDDCEQLTAEGLSIAAPKEDKEKRSFKAIIT
jgi:hypothetical protein